MSRVIVQNVIVCNSTWYDNNVFLFSLCFTWSFLCFSNRKICSFYLQVTWKNLPTQPLSFSLKKLKVSRCTYIYVINSIRDKTWRDVIACFYLCSSSVSTNSKEFANTNSLKCVQMSRNISRPQKEKIQLFYNNVQIQIQILLVTKRDSAWFHVTCVTCFSLHCTHIIVLIRESSLNRKNALVLTCAPWRKAASRFKL